MATRQRLTALSFVQKRLHGVASTPPLPSRWFDLLQLLLFPLYPASEKLRKYSGVSTQLSGQSMGLAVYVVDVGRSKRLHFDKGARL
jgi:hypothetical protein